jgi:DNA-binding MurR/RpiR family transcriptional regulator
MLLIDQIRANLDSSSEAELRFVDYVLAHPEVIYKTITEVLEESGASYGTVIRYCKKLGCSGYQDFKIRLAYESAITENNVKDDEGISNTEVYINQILNTARNLDPEKVEEIARSIIQARRILVVGLAGSFPMALELCYRLTRFGFNSIADSDEHMQAIRASAMNDEDILIAISFSGSTKGILDSATIAKKNKARVLAITNSLRSPLVELADYTILTALWEQALKAEVGSRIPFIFIIEELTSAITRLYPKAEQIIKQTSDSVSGKQI